MSGPSKKEIEMLEEAFQDCGSIHSSSECKYCMKRDNSAATPTFGDFSANLSQYIYKEGDLKKPGIVYVREEIEIDRNDHRAKYVIGGFSKFCDDDCKCKAIVYEKDGGKYYTWVETDHSDYCYEGGYKDWKKNYSLARKKLDLPKGSLHFSPDIGDELKHIANSHGLVERKQNETDEQLRTRLKNVVKNISIKHGFKLTNDFEADLKRAIVEVGENHFEYKTDISFNEDYRPKCDCGAVKCKTTHADWCSTNHK